MADHPLVTKHRNTQTTYDNFVLSDFQYGSNDCAHLVNFHLLQFGHADHFAACPPYTNYRSALKAMKAIGVKSIEDHLSSILPEIAPAYMGMGDIAAFDITDGKERYAFGVFLGKGKVLAFKDGKCGYVTDTQNVVKAWKVAEPVGVN